MTDPPRLLSDFNRPAGLIKADYSDFIVEEEPLYPAAGDGDHTYFLVEKAGLSTQQAIQDIARALNLPKRNIGYAGLKDSRAITRQWMSVEHVPPETVAAISLPRIEIVEVTRHRNKIRLGHLRGNRFTIHVRQTDATRLADLQNALAELVKRGAPNYFGEQRFGNRGDTWAIGAAMVRGQIDEAVDLALGRPGPLDHGKIRRARELYQAGKYADAARHWPGMFHDARRALKALAQTGNKTRAFSAIDRHTRQFYLSAYQSYLFNHVLAARLSDGPDHLLTGDLAEKHANHAVFLVEDADAEQPRADAFEISPTGPLFGRRMTQPTGRPAEIEAQILANEGLSFDQLCDSRLRTAGARRALRFRVEDADISVGGDEAGVFLTVRLFLPRGCYATTVLRELFSWSAADDPTAADA